MTLSDQMRGTGGRGIDFSAAWDSGAARNFAELEETFVLGASVTTLEGAVQSLVGFLGLESVERSHRVAPDSVGHTLLLAGIFRGAKEVLARARLALADGQVTMQLSVRSPDPNVAELITSSVG